LVQWSGYRLDKCRLMVSFTIEATERSLLHLIYTVSVPDTSSYLMDTGGLFPMGRATGHEVDQLPPFVTRFKREWSCTSTPPHAFRARTHWLRPYLFDTSMSLGFLYKLHFYLQLIQIHHCKNNKMISLQTTFDGDDLNKALNAVQLSIPLFQLHPLINGWCVAERQDLSFPNYLPKSVPSPVTDYTIFHHHIEHDDSET
jgi:hypothetical protein